MISRVLGPVTPLEVTLRQAYRRLSPLNADGKVLRLLCPSCERIFPLNDSTVHLYSSILQNHVQQKGIL